MEFMTLGKKWHNKIMKLTISPIVINEIEKVELSGITINCKLTFNENLHSLGFNANYKLYTLCRIKKHLNSGPGKVFAQCIY